MLATLDARAWAGRALLAAVLVAVVAADPSPLRVIAGLFVLVVPFERLFPRHCQPLRRPGLGTDLAYALAQPLLTVVGLVVGLGIGVLSLAWVPGLVLRPLVAAVGPAPRIVLGFLLFDLAAYWVHRWSHEVPFLWRFHMVHHSSQHLDWISGLRSHPLDGALIGVPVAFLLGAGFTPQVAALPAALLLILGIFAHANVRWRWRPLQRIVQTPEMHHWHHADDPAAHNRNYTGLLPLWDMLFGTFYLPPDRRPEVYGVAEPLPAGIVGQLRHPLRALPPARWAVAHPGRAGRRLAESLVRGARQVGRVTVGASP
jgi:sterol desaturase/sphingolipid hydroxylase (fatty acid hydroxylase superfamily)